MKAYELPRWYHDPFCEDIRVDEIFIDTSDLVGTSSQEVLGFFQILKLSLTRTFVDEKYTAAAGNPIPVWEMADVDPDTGTDIYKGVSAEQLDIMFLNHSGDKILRKKLADRILYRRTHTFTDALFPIPAEFAYAVLPVVRMYSQKWRDLWATMFYDFDPIENYNMVEQLQDSEKIFTHGKTETLTNNLQHSKTGTETDTPNITATETDQKWGFNSDNGVNSDKRTTQQTGNDTRTYNTQDADTGTATNAASGQDTETHEYTLTRKGNIGVTTSQQMIEQQRKLLMFNYFNEIVFPDIDKIITLSVY